MRYAILAIPGFLAVFGAPAVQNDETCVELVAGQPVPMAPATTIGDICLETHEGNVVVRFRAAQGWNFTETQLAVASALGGIPRAQEGVPIIGRFPYRQAHTPMVSEYLVSIPLAELGVSPGEEVIVAAHASMINTAGVEEGGWGRGERFTPIGNPAMYFRYTITD